MIEPGNIFEMVVYTKAQAQLGLVVRQYRLVSNPAAGASDIELAHSLSRAFSLPFRTAMAELARFEGVSVQQLTPTLGPKVYSNALNGIGVGADGLAPKQLSGLIRLVSDGAGRHGKGRAYIPFPSKSKLGILGEPTDTYLDNLANIGPKFVTLQTTKADLATAYATLEGVIRNPTPPPVVVNNYSTIMGYSLPKMFATQRRRGDFGKINTLPF